MNVHALSTGGVSTKRAFIYAGSGIRRQLDLFLPGEWMGPFPIHAWAVEHDGQLILVDTGETAAARDIPFARFSVSERDELPHALNSVGLEIHDVSLAVLTHMHGDHMDGAVHLQRPVLAHDEEIAFQHSAGSRFFQKVLRQPIPGGVDFQPLKLDDGPFGAFERSKRLTDDGRVMAVATPGHTPGHISIICIDDAGRHLFLAGDATDTLEQLNARRPDAVGPKPAVTVATIDRILAHMRDHETVYLPSHDPESAARLAATA